MRVIILLKTGEHYVLSRTPHRLNDTFIGDLAAGGRLTVPIDNITAFETYNDSQLEQLRMRLRELEAKDK